MWRQADRQASYNFQTSKLLAALILNFNLHRVHHRYPALPWSKIPRAFAEDRETYDGALLPAALQQLAARYRPRYLSGPIEQHLPAKFFTLTPFFGRD